MKKLLFTSILIISSYALIAQVGGVSNSKLASLNIDAIGHHTVEFEPTVYHFSSKKYWDNDGSLQNLYGSADSINKNTGLAFRFTYGLWDKLEIGGSISTDLAASSLGIKYKFWSNDKMGFAAIAGANIPLGNKTIDNSSRYSKPITTLGAGMIYTAYLSDRLSIDATGQYFFYTEKTDYDYKGSYYINSDIGYYVFNNTLQLIAGFGYQGSTMRDVHFNTFTMYPGLTVETGKRYVLVLQAPFDIAGKNSAKNVGVSFSLTITID